MNDEGVRLTAWVHGRVQGVGFRYWTHERADELGLVGEAVNLSDGRVRVIVEGPRRGCEALVRLLRSGATPGRVDRVADSWDAPRGEVHGFVER